MNSKTVSGISLILLGALISIVPNFLVYQHCMQMAAKCTYSAKTEFAIGILIIILAAMLLLFESREARLGISISLIFIGIFAALVPTMLIGFCDGKCGNPGCTCSSFTTLIMAALSILVALISVVNVICINNTKK